MHLTSLLVAVKGEIEARGCGLSLLLYNQRAKHPLIIVVLRRMWLVFGSRTGDNDNLNESHGHKGFFFPSTQPEPRHRQTVESKGAVDLFLSS